MVAVLALYFLVRALGNVPRSRRYGNLALFCGLIAFPRPWIAPYLPQRPMLVALVVLGAAGIGLAVLALLNRRDGGCGIIRAVLGIVMGLVTLSAGAIPLRFQMSTSPIDPWVYRAADASYRLTMPSARWKMTKTNERGKVPRVIFYQESPRMQVSHAVVEVDQTEAQFREMTDSAQTSSQSDPDQRVTMRKGVNEAGHAYRYFTTMESTSEGKVFVAISYTWIPAKHRIVQLIFEAPSSMWAKENRAAAEATFAQQAEAILLSVE
jgi:hypothetical protein